MRFPDARPKKRIGQNSQAQKLSRQRRSRFKTQCAADRQCKRQRGKLSRAREGQMERTRKEQSQVLSPSFTHRAEVAIHAGANQTPALAKPELPSGALEDLRQLNIVENF